MLKVLYVSCLVCFMWIWGCAITDGDPNTTIGDSTLGNGQIDVQLGDGKLFGSERAYQIGITAAQIAVFKEPQLAYSIKEKLLNIKSKSDRMLTQRKLNGKSATEFVIYELRRQCGFYCQTVAGQAYLDSYIDRLGEVADELAMGFERFSPAELIDQLIAQIELVEVSVQ